MSDWADGAASPGEPPPDLLLEVERLIAQLQHQHGVEVRDKVTQLLEDVDAVHRAGLTHLMDAIRGMAGDAFVNRLIADPAIRMLLMSYDLVPVDRRLMAEEAIDSVRGHLHAHGVDVEIREVVGGVVYVRLHGPDRGPLTDASVVRDLEEALGSGFVGFQELVTRDRAGGGIAIPIGGLRRARRPVYCDVLDADALVDGGMTAVEVGGQPVLLARVGSEHYAVANRCGDSPLPLEFSTLSSAELCCSWHQCRYDVRTGARLDAQAGRLRVFPVRVESGRVLIAVEVEPADPGTG